jgi:transposase
MAELKFELWIGDAAEIRSQRVRKQKTDRQDAQLILRLLLENRFPQIWIPSWENRDLRQLLWPRHRMVQAGTRIMNQLQAVALNEGLRWKKRLWREAGREQLESFALAPWASRRRRDLLELLDRLSPTIPELTQAIEQEVEKCPEAQRLATHPGVGALTALAFVLIIGSADRFQCGKQIASYLGLVPSEESSGDRRRLGHISKQGNTLLRFLLVEAAQVTVRSDQEWRSKYFHLALRRGRKIAKVAMARKLAVRLYWMWRKGWDHEQMRKFGSHAGEPGTGVGVLSNTEYSIGYPAPLCGGVRTGNHDRGCDRRDAWVGPSVLAGTLIASEPWWDGTSSTRAKWRALRSAQDSYAHNLLDAADIVRDAWLLRLTSCLPVRTKPLAWRTLPRG